MFRDPVERHENEGYGVLCHPLVKHPRAVANADTGDLHRFHVNVLVPEFISLFKMQELRAFSLP